MSANSNFSRIRAVIFDLDGTLLYTLEDLRNAVNHALSMYHFPLRTTEEIKNFIGNGVQVLMRRSAPLEASDELCMEMLDVFRIYYLAHMYDHTAPYEGILAMLDSLSSQGYLTAIVSNKLDEATKQMNTRFFAPHNKIAIGAPADKKKPNPISVFEALKELGVSSAEAVYVGDSDVDVETAHNAGLPCIGCSWGYRGRDYLEAYGADAVIDTPSELLSLLRC